MSQVFDGNPFPQHLYKADSFEGLYVNSKKELEEALREGWSQKHIPHEYPKWVPTGEVEKIRYRGQGADGTDLFIDQPVAVLAQNKAQEERILAQAKKKDKQQAAA